MQTIFFLIVGLAAAYSDDGMNADQKDHRTPAVDTTHVIGHPTVPSHFCRDTHYSLCNCDNGRYGPCKCHCDNHKCCAVKNDTQVCDQYVNWPDTKEVDGRNQSQTYLNCNSYMARVKDMCNGKPFLESRQSECETAGFTCWKAMNMEYGCNSNETTSSQLGVCIMERMNYHDCRKSTCKFDCNGTFSDEQQDYYKPFWSQLNNTGLDSMGFRDLCLSATGYYHSYQDGIKAMGCVLAAKSLWDTDASEEKKTVDVRYCLPGSTYNTHSYRLANDNAGAYDFNYKNMFEHHLGVTRDHYLYQMKQNERHQYQTHENYRGIEPQPYHKDAHNDNGHHYII